MQPADKRAEFEAIDARLREDIAAALIAHYGGRRRGDEVDFSCLNKAAHRNGDRNPSASFNVKSGAWNCQGCGEKGHAGALAGALGLPPPAAPGVVPIESRRSRAAPASTRPAARVEMVYAECSACGGQHQRPARGPGKLGEPSAWWFYHGTDGEPVAVALRFEIEGGGKTFRQFDLLARTWKAPPSPRPLYRLDELTRRAGEPVVLVEGEKCADALAGLGILATTAMGGAQGIGQADLSSLAGRAVYRWRDNDEPGEEWAEDLREALPAAGVTGVFEIPVPPDVPPKWDAADAVAEGWDAARVRELIGQAEAAPMPDPIADLFAEMRATWAADLPAEVEPRDEVVENLIEAREIAVVYGKSNSGKTFFVLSLAEAVARGVDFHGRRVDPGLVVYLASESPGGVRRRIQATQRIHGTLPRDLLIIERPLSFFDGDGDADNVVKVVRAAEEIAGKPARLVIGDTLARMAAGANENAGEDMGPVMMRFDRVAEHTDAAVVIVHHMGKNAAAGSRGWSGIQGHIATEIEIEAGEDYRRAEVTKQRELPSKGQQIYFKLEVVELGANKWGGTMTTCVAVPDPDAAARAPATKTREDTATVRRAKYRRWIERFWWHSGAPIRSGFPFVARAAFKEWLMSTESGTGFGEKTAKNHLAPHGDGKLIGDLVHEGDIRDENGDDGEPGWIVVEPGWSSQLLLSKASK